MDTILYFKSPTEFDANVIAAIKLAYSNKSFSITVHEEGNNDIPEWQMLETEKRLLEMESNPSSTLSKKLFFEELHSFLK